MNINDLWNNTQESFWEAALNLYYEDIQNEELENRMERLTPQEIEAMSAPEFYNFLHDEYFVWKFNSPNRLASTRYHLEKYNPNDLDTLHHIQLTIVQAFGIKPDGAEVLLSVTSLIHGLGTAGASGLLSLIYPEYYGTVDQHVVYALRGITNLSEHTELMEMNPENLKITDGVLLETIMRNKSNELNALFSTNDWTPRKIDMLLYAIHKRSNAL